MSNTLPLTVQGTALPPQVKWSPQQLANFIWSKARIVTSASYALFVAGSTAPTSNVGPWWKDDSTWYRWDNNTGSYVPQLIDQASLGYFIGPSAPNPLIYSFWIETAAGGSPLALKIYFSGAWTDVYATKFADYLTIVAAASTYAPLASPALTGTPTAPTAAPGTNTTQLATTAFVEAEVAPLAPIASPTFTGTPAAPTAAPGTNTAQLATTAFVEAAIGGLPGAFAAYPAQGVAGSQSVPVDGAQHQVLFASASINPAPAPFSTVTNRYTAPATGIYNVSFSSQFDNDTGAAATMQVAVSLYKNGVFVGFAMADLDNTPSPTGDRWSPGFSGLVSLTAADYLEIFVEADDGINTGALDLTVAQISVNRVSA